MQPTTDLVKLREAVFTRVLRLRQIVPAPSSTLTADDRRALAFVTIELDNLIIVGLRQYTKSSLLRSRTSKGARITASVQPTSTQAAAAYIYRSLNPRGYANLNNPTTIAEENEIPFRDPKRAEKVLTDYSASNLPSLALALSLNAEVFNETKICRHYFAHRAQNTFDSVRNFAASFGVIGIDMPEQLLMRGRPTTGVRFIDGWLADVENFFDLAI